MLYPSINELRKKVDSRYTLVVMSAKRARDIVEGKPILTENCDNEKPISVAAYEVEEGYITYNRDEDTPKTEEE